MALPENYIKDIDNNELNTFQLDLLGGKGLDDLSGNVNSWAENYFSERSKDKTMFKKDQDFYETQFNKALDNKISELKYTEIVGASDAVKDKLKTLEFEIELSALQDDIVNGTGSQSTERAEVSDRVNLKDAYITWTPKNKVEKSKIVDEINKIKNNATFTDMSELLKSGSVDDIKKFQLKMLNVLRPKEDVNGGIIDWAEDTWNVVENAISGGPLGKQGVDGLFGKDTMSALEDYVEAVNESEVDGVAVAANDSANGSVAGGGGNNTAKNNLNGNANTNSVENKKQTTETKFSNQGISTNLDNDQNGLEVMSGGDLHVVMEKGGEQTLGKGFNAVSDQITILGGHKTGKIKIENDGTLKYTGKKSGQDTVRVMVKDKNGNIKFNHVITFDVKKSQQIVSQNVDTQKMINDLIKKIRDVEYIEDRQKMINTHLNFLKADYKGIKDVDANSSYTTSVGGVFAGLVVDEHNKSKIVNQISIDLFPKLLEEKEICRLEGQFTDLTDKTFVGSAKKSLAGKIPENNVHINIGGETMTLKDFMKKINKKKINWGPCKILDLDLKMKEPTESYLNDPGKKIEHDIKNLVISDDPDYLKKGHMVKNNGTQYKSETWATSNVEKMDEVKSKKNRKALKKLLKQCDESLNISRPGYKPSNKEKRRLRNLKGIFNKFHSSKINAADAFAEVFAKHNADTDGQLNWKKQTWETAGVDKGGDKRKMAKLGELYSLYKNPPTNGGGGDYFDSVMKSFETYFVQGVEGVNVYGDEADSIVKMVNHMNIGRVEGLLVQDKGRNALFVNPDKERQAIRRMFNNKGKKFSVGGVDYAKSDELSKLKHIVKGVELSSLMQRINASGGKKPSDLKRREGKFYDLYIEYKKNKDAGGENLDAKGNPKIGECNTYYNAVFDALVGMGEGRQDIVEAVNSIDLLANIDNVEYHYTDYPLASKGDYVKMSVGGGDTYVPVTNKTKKEDRYNLELNDEAWYSCKAEKQILILLCDVNSDGRIDTGDIEGIRTGLELQDIYKDVKVYAEKGGADKGAIENLIAFVKYQLDATGESSLESDMKDVTNAESLFAAMRKNTGLINYIQNILINSPIPVENILEGGEKAGGQYFEDLKIGDGDVEALRLRFEEEYLKLVSQGLNDTEEVRAKLKPMIYGALLENNGNYGGGLGAGLAWDTGKIGTFSLNLGYSQIPVSNGTNQEVVGVLISWGDAVALNNDGTTKLGAGVSVGAIGKESFIPMASGGVGIQKMINKNNLKNSLRPIGAKSIGMGININLIGLDNPIPSWGLGASRSQDKLKGIDTQYENIRIELSGADGVISKVLRGIDFSNDDSDNIKYELKKNLNTAFPNAKEGELAAAADNIYRALSYYGINGMFDDVSDPQLTRIVLDISQNYALQWKNEATKGLDRKLFVEGAGVGVQFLAGFYPIPVIGVSLAHYENLYSRETSESLARYHAELLTGRGMEDLDTKITEPSVDLYGNITKGALMRLNQQLNPRKDMDVPDIILKANGSVGGNVVGQSLWIPKGLYEKGYASVNISDDMKKYTHTIITVEIIEEDNDGNDVIKVKTVDRERLKNPDKEYKNKKEYIEVPANTVVSLLTASKAKDGKAHLIIGDTKVKSDDIQLYHGVEDDYEFRGTPSNYENEGVPYIEKREINTKLRVLSGSISALTTSSDLTLPLTTCDKVENGKAVFFLDNAANCVDMGGANSDLRIDVANNKMIMPQFGTLTIYKNVGGKNELYYSSDPSNNLKIDYSTAEYVDAAARSVEIVGDATWEVSSVLFGGSDVFYGISSDVNALFTGDIIEGLRDLDLGTDGYVFLTNFLDYSSRDIDSDTDTDIDEDEYIKASEVLMARFGDKFENIKDFLKNSSISDEKKSLVINRIKGILAFDADVAKGADVYVLKDGDRKSAYQKLRGPSGVLIGDKLNGYRDKVFNKIEKKDGELSREVDLNLFGYTAFYRKGTAEGRNFSMTAPGDTKVLGGVKEKISDESDGVAAKAWFMKNFALNKVTQNVVAESIISQLEGVDVTDKSVVEEYIKDNLLELITKGGKTLDIPEGKYKIKLDLDYYFYLLGECANESIGIKLTGVTVKKKTEVVDPNPNQFGMTANGGMRYRAGVFVNNIEAQNELMLANKRDLHLGFAVAKAMGFEEIVPPVDGTWEIVPPADGTWDGTGIPVDGTWYKPPVDGTWGGGNIVAFASNTTGYLYIINSVNGQIIETIKN